MKKRILSILLAVLIVVGMFPVTAMANDYVAQIGEQKYETLAAAYQAANDGDHIEILVDKIELTDVPSTKENIIVSGLVDENGKPATTVTKWTANTGSHNIGCTFENFKITSQTQNSKNNNGGVYGFAMDNTTLKNIEVNRPGQFYGFYMTYCYGKAIFEDCVFNAYCYGVHFDGTATGEIEFKNCTLKGWCSFAGNAAFNFYNCTFDTVSPTSSYCIMRNYSDCTMTNCKFTESFVEFVDDYYGCKLNPVNDNTTLTVINGSIIDANGNPSTKGYTIDKAAYVFTTEEDREKAVVAFDPTGNETVGYSAGTFVTWDSENIKCAENCKAYSVEGKENTYEVKELPDVAQIGDTKYKTLADAIAAVQANNTEPVTIELLKDIVLDSAVSINKDNVVIDGKGFTISADQNYDGFAQYKVGGDKQGYGKYNLITVSGENVTVKNLTVDVKDYRGMSCMTTKGGKDVTYENVTYKGRGSGHYYGYGTGGGTVTFKNCTVNTQGYGIHFAQESVDTDKVVIDGCTIYGWNSFGTCESVTVKNSYFGSAWDGDGETAKNGTLAMFRPYCKTTMTNCKFSEDYLSTPTEAQGGDKKDYTGIGTGDPVTVSLNGCSIVDADGKTVSNVKLYNLIDYTSAFDNQEAADGSLFIFDALGDATTGYTAGTFVTALNANTIKTATGYKLNEVADIDTKAKVYTIAEEATVSEGGKIISGTDEKGDPKEIEVKGTGEGEGEGKPTVAEAATAITETLNNPEVANFTETKIEEATPVTPETTVQNVDGTNFNLSMILNALKVKAGEQFTGGEAKATANDEITIKTTTEGEGEGEKFVDTDVSKQIKVDLTAAEVRQEQLTTTTTTVTSMTFDVKPIATIVVTNGENTETVTAVIPNEAITKPITFRLPVNSSITAKTAAVYHEGVLMGIYEIKEENNNKFIEVSSKTFSRYTYEILDELTAAAKIDNTYYPSLAEAVKNAGGKTIRVINDTNEVVIVERAMNFKLEVADGVKFTGAIRPGDNYVRHIYGDKYYFELYEAGDTIVIGGNRNKDTKTETKEENPETGAPVLSMSTGIVLAGIVLVLAKRK